MKIKDFKKWLLGVNELTPRQRREASVRLEALRWSGEEKGWRDTDNPTVEFRSMTSFAT